MKTISSLLFGIGLVFAASASADTLWDLENVTFAGTFIGFPINNTATGWFDVNSSGQIDNWQITVTGTNSAADTGSSPFDPSDGTVSIVSGTGSKEIKFVDTHNNPILILELASALPSGSGSPINLTNGSEACGSGICTSYASQGYIMDPPSAVPEPSSVAFAIPAILGMAFVVRRRMLAAKQ